MQDKSHPTHSDSPSHLLDNYENTLYLTSRDMDIIWLLSAGSLTDFEKSFLKSVQKQKVWTKKQRMVFEKITARYFKP
jgi:hypothetical protein